VGDKKFRPLLSTLILTSLLSCWKKQSHEITAPVMPGYTVTGLVTDSNSAKPIQQVVIELMAAFTIYECDSLQHTQVTDSAGYFEFRDVCPGFYTLICRRENIAVVEFKLQIEHTDTSFHIDVPPILPARLKLSRTDLSGIVWRDIETCVFMTDEEHEKEGQRIYTLDGYYGNFSTGFFRIGGIPFLTHNDPILGLALADTNYVVFTGGIQHPSLLLFQIETGDTTGLYPAPHRLLDLTYDGTMLWATSTKPSMIRWSLIEADRISEYDLPATHPGGIAWDGRYIWSAEESDMGRPRLFRYDENFRVAEVFCPVSSGTNLEKKPLYFRFLAFDPSGTLWGITTNDLYEIDFVAR
jgi:hypothetical protein